ncbi:hypothetical protein GQR58_016538 [Nymphon striatum]|nr:hypothetical protein GQR58_016538 [Nymphon striatum]
MLLRGCLGPGPKATVRGLGLDYIEMWKELDANYGNPRLVSDAVLADIDRFRELKEGDNQRFIEYVNVIQAGYHVLKQVGRPGDIDNNAMLSRIEQKLAYDMKVEWSRHLEQLRVENQKVQDLLKWLETEKRTRIRTFAAVRNGPNARINQVSSAPDQRVNWFKCWSCQSNEHWLDQCQQFQDMSPDERLKRIKDAHACFSCLKKASAGHNLSSCRRQRQ